MWSLRRRLAASLVFSIVLVYAAPLDVAGLDDALHNIDGELVPAKWPTTSVVALENLPDREATGVAEAEPAALDALYAHTVAPFGVPAAEVDLHLPSEDSPPPPKGGPHVSLAPGGALSLDPNRFLKGIDGGSTTAPNSYRGNSWTWSGGQTVIPVFFIVMCGAAIGWVCENFRIDL